MLHQMLAPQELNAPSAWTCWQEWNALADRLAPVLTSPLSRPDTLDTLHEVAQGLMQLGREHPDVAIFHFVHAPCLELQRYGITHALHTAWLMSLIAQRKDWGPADERTGVLAALSMNLSITPLQSELATQLSPLSEPQRKAIEHHPTESRWILEALGVSNADWLDAVEQHHEQPDGTGYPRGLHRMHPMADALRTCDVLGAKLSPRSNRPGLLSSRAAAEIFRHRSAGYFGATLIRELGLYPPGSLVELNNGEVAVVLRRSRDPMTPDVVVLSDGLGRPAASLMRCATSRAPGRHIVRASARQDCRAWIDLPALFSLA